MPVAVVALPGLSVVGQGPPRKLPGLAPLQVAQHQADASLPVTSSLRRRVGMGVLRQGGERGALTSIMSFRARHCDQGNQSNAVAPVLFFLTLPSLSVYETSTHSYLSASRPCRLVHTRTGGGLTSCGPSCTSLPLPAVHVYLQTAALPGLADASSPAPGVLRARAGDTCSAWAWGQSTMSGGGGFSVPKVLAPSRNTKLLVM